MKKDHSLFAARNVSIIAVAPHDSAKVKKYWSKETLPYIGIPDADGVLGSREFVRKSPEEQLEYIDNLKDPELKEEVLKKKEAIDLYRQSIVSGEISKEDFAAIFAEDRNLLVSLGTNPEDLPILLDYLLFIVG